jgi:hypothetical protein
MCGLRNDMYGAVSSLAGKLRLRKQNKMIYLSDVQGPSILCSAVV